MIRVDNIQGGYNGKEIVKGVSFTVEKGKILGILGPNGSGKSTLLKLISGVLKQTDGNVWIDGRALSSYESKALAKKMAVLPQLNANAFSNSVYETVSIGRYPYQKGLFARWSEADEQAVQQAMENTGVSKYARDDLSILSGGEQQRVFIAQALAQQAEILLLDEPTNHLDIAHQKQILDVLQQEVCRRELTVVSIFHDINLAALYCDELLLLEAGRIRVIGAPHEVVSEATITDVYNADIRTAAHPTAPKPQITLLPENVHHSEQKIGCNDIKIYDDYVLLQTKKPLKTVSSAVHNAGIGWYSTFINRTVSHDLVIDDVQQEMAQFLTQQHFTPSNSVAMLTTVFSENATVKSYTDNDWTITIMITAAVTHAVDVSQSYQHSRDAQIGTINTWVIINGHLSDEAFLQAMMTATEAKTKALLHLQVKDPLSNTIATGTSTDSLLIAATQEGPTTQYAGTITPVGKLIGRGVFEATVEALQKRLLKK